MRDASSNPWGSETKVARNLMIHPELQVLRFVRLVDVESSMIKKHRAVAKIVSQVWGCGMLSTGNPRKLALRCTRYQVAHVFLRDLLQNSWV